MPVGKPRLLDQVRATIRAKHYRLRTEKTYVHWITRFIYFTGKRHPAGLGAAEVTAFLNDLGTTRNMATAPLRSAAIIPLREMHQNFRGENMGGMRFPGRVTAPTATTLPAARITAPLARERSPRLR